MLAFLTLRGTSEEAPTRWCFLVVRLWDSVLSPGPSLRGQTACWGVTSEGGETSNSAGELEASPSAECTGDRKQGSVGTAPSDVAHQGTERGSRVGPLFC